MPRSLYSSNKSVKNHIPRGIEPLLPKWIILYHSYIICILLDYVVEPILFFCSTSRPDPKFKKNNLTLRITRIYMCVCVCGCMFYLSLEKSNV